MLESLISTTQGKVILGLGGVGTVIGMFANPSIVMFLVSMLMYSGLAFNATCLAKGGCDTWSWFTIAIPIIVTLIYIIISLRSGSSKTSDEEVEPTPGAGPTTAPETTGAPDSTTPQAKA